MNSLLDRNALTNRDVFDCWFCMKQRVALSRPILDVRLDCTFEQYMENCVRAVSRISSTRILDGMGEFLDDQLKGWARSSLVGEFVTLARMYREMPLIE